MTVDARPLGWYIAFLLPSDIYLVLGLAATPGNEEALFRHVLREAKKLNAAAVAGRVESWLLEVFPRRMMMFSRVRFLIHSRNEAICEAVRSSKSLLTGLERDIWLPRWRRFHPGQAGSTSRATTPSTAQDRA